MDQIQYAWKMSLDHSLPAQKFDVSSSLVRTAAENLMSLFAIHVILT